VNPPLLFRLAEASPGGRFGLVRPSHVRLGEWCPHVYRQTCAGREYYGAEALRWTLGSDGVTETCWHRQLRYREDVQAPGPDADIPKLVGDADLTVRTLLAAEGIV
jgi:hypothetical protein